MIMSGKFLAGKKGILYTFSGLRLQTAKSLVDGNALKPLIPSWCHKTSMAEEETSGMVKIKWIVYNAQIGNPHALKERQRLNGDWYCALSAMLKVQSGFQGNLKDYTDGWVGVLQLECYLLYLWYCNSYYNHFLITHSKNESITSLQSNP
jgi:hypothetical protein